MLTYRLKSKPDPLADRLSNFWTDTQPTACRDGFLAPWKRIMGYTHYFEADLKGIPTEQWSAICRDIKTLIKHLPEHSTNAGGYHSADPLKIALRRRPADETPMIGKNRIRFNGTGGDDLGYHETFGVLERKAEAKRLAQGANRKPSRSAKDRAQAVRSCRLCCSHRCRHACQRTAGC